MLKKIVVGVVALVAVLLALISTRPDHFRIERSIAVAAPPAIVFAQLNDFHRWEGWSPWAKLDSAMKTTYQGPSEGVGASYSWVGNSKVGEGKMTIEETRPGERVAIRLEFLKPFAAVNQTVFEIAPGGGQSNLSWVMTGNHSFMGKAMSLFMDMDKMVGPDFERGLSSLKTIAEQAARIEPPAPSETPKT